MHYQFTPTPLQLQRRVCFYWEKNKNYYISKQASLSYSDKFLASLYRLQ